MIPMLQDPLPTTEDPPPQIPEATGPAAPELPAGAEESSSVLESLSSLVNNELFKVGDKPITALSLVTAVVIVLFAFQFSSFMQGLVERGLRRLGIESEGTVGSLNRLIHYSLVVLGLLFAVSQLGIKLEALLAAGAIFAVAFGFAMQNIAQNFVSGVILLVERSIKPGDVLELEGKIVRVSEMGIRSTVVRTLDEEEMIVPNSLLVQNTVKNFTLNDNVHRLRATVGVIYGSDMKLVQKTLEEMAQELDWRDRSRAPRVHLLQFADSSVLWEVSIWIRNPWLKQRLSSRLHEAIWWTLKDKSITVAFPQLDVHLDPRFEEVIRKLSPHKQEAET